MNVARKSNDTEKLLSIMFRPSLMNGFHFATILKIDSASWRSSILFSLHKNCSFILTKDLNPMTTIEKQSIFPLVDSSYDQRSHMNLD